MNLRAAFEALSTRIKARNLTTHPPRSILPSSASLNISGEGYPYAIGTTFLEPQSGHRFGFPFGEVPRRPSRLGFPAIAGPGPSATGRGALAPEGSDHKQGHEATEASTGPGRPGLQLFRRASGAGTVDRATRLLRRQGAGSRPRLPTQRRHASHSLKEIQDRVPIHTSSSLDTRSRSPEEPFGILRPQPTATPRSQPGMLSYGLHARSSSVRRRVYSRPIGNVASPPAFYQGYAQPPLEFASIVNLGSLLSLSPSHSLSHRL